MSENSNWKTTIYVAGALAGLLTGLAAAFLYIRSQAEDEQSHTISSGQGLKIGMGVVSLLKMITERNP